MYERGFKSWCERVALQQRRELNLKPIDPLDARRLAEHLSILVWTANQVPELDAECLQVLTQEDPDSWSAITICEGTKDLIILNPVHSEARRAGDMMHEIAHILIGHEPARVDVSEDGLLLLNTYDKKQEDEAKWLAGCLLLPRDALLLIRRQRIDVATAAERFRVSQSMVEFRWNVTRLGPQFSRQRGTTTSH